MFGGQCITTTVGTTTPVLTSQFPLGAGDPGAARTSQPQPVFSLGGAPKFSLAAPTAPAAVPPATNTTTSTTGFASESSRAFSQPVTTSSFAGPSTIPSFTAASTAFTPPTTTFTEPSTSTFSVTSTSALTTAASQVPGLATTSQTTLGTSTSVTDSTSRSASLNFCQLEEAINKWTLELEEQEKLFMNQASQVNAWDRLLIGNGEKIINLNNAVEQVKLEQQQLDHELDFILAQQRELEDLLTPLEKELETNSISDPEREHTYQLAENLDTQLKQMSEDLKEIVEHINETNRSQDNTDPIVQIGRILNAHMNSLQWIDQNTTLIGSHLDQVAKLHEVHRRENERSFRLTYD